MMLCAAALNLCFFLIILPAEKIFRKKIEDQREELKKEIKRCVPAFIQESMRESEKRLENVYGQIILEAERTENTWLEAQKAAVKESENTQTDGKASGIGSMIEKLRRQEEIIHTMINEEVQNGKQ